MTETEATQTEAVETVEMSVVLTIDGAEVGVAAGASVLDACTAAGVDTPTICCRDTLTPVNTCRACVVEVEGSRTLVPACSRLAESDMVISTDSERVRHSRKIVLEFLASGVDLSQADQLTPYLDRYGAEPDRYPKPEGMNEPVRVQDDLFVRDYDKCVLCYQCVEACGHDAQRTFAISVVGRGFGARISTEFDASLPDSACVYCGNCVAVCPTNALQFKSEYDLRQADNWRPGDQSVTRTVCSYCGVGCNLELHVQDNSIVKATSPADHSVTSGNLCIKGRFGWNYVEPVNGEPNHSEPVNGEPNHSEPVNGEPNHSEPVNSEPDHSEPVNGEPNNNEPVRGRAAES